MERLLRLMKMLTGNIQYTIDELSDKLETSPRSIYRYIDTFKAAGFVVRKYGNVYRLCKESPYFKDISQLIHFTNEEAYLVNRLIDSIDDTNLLKQNLRRKLASVYDCTAMANLVVNKQDAANVNQLIAGIEEKHQVILKDYASSHTGDIRDRLVEAFAFTTNYVQVWCYDPETQTNKLFKTARIGTVEVASAPWQHADLHRQGFVDIFRMTGHNQYPVKLELGVMAHNLILEEYPLSQQYIKQIAPERWLLTTSVCNYAGAARFVIGLADNVKIVDSPDLVAYIRRFTVEHVAKL